MSARERGRFGKLTEALCRYTGKAVKFRRFAKRLHARHRRRGWKQYGIDWDNTRGNYGFN